MLRVTVRSSGITGTGFGNVKPLASLPWRNKIRLILVDEQDHQIDLATALGEEVPDLSATCVISECPTLRTRPVQALSAGLVQALLRVGSAVAILEMASCISTGDDGPTELADLG